MDAPGVVAAEEAAAEVATRRMAHRQFLGAFRRQLMALA